MDTGSCAAAAVAVAAVAAVAAVEAAPLLTAITQPAAAIRIKMKHRRRLAAPPALYSVTGMVDYGSVSVCVRVEGTNRLTSELLLLLPLSSTLLMLLLLPRALN